MQLAEVERIGAINWNEQIVKQREYAKVEIGLSPLNRTGE